MQLQKRLTPDGKDRLLELRKPYSYGPYDKSDQNEQWVRITEGCPNQCPYCYEPEEFKVFPTPKIVRNTVKIMDMNLLCKPEARAIITQLGKERVGGKVVHYELICGIDFRFLTHEMAKLLHENRFRRIRLAWDWGYGNQKMIKKAIDFLKDAGYRNDDLTIFMICNWKIPYDENVKKMDLCKVWNVRIADCWFDGQVSPDIQPIYWTKEQIDTFRASARKHNQLINFKLDPEEDYDV